MERAEECNVFVLQSLTNHHTAAETRGTCASSNASFLALSLSDTGLIQLYKPFGVNLSFWGLTNDRIFCQFAGDLDSSAHCGI